MKKYTVPWVVLVVIWGLVFGFAGLSHAGQTNLVGTVWNAETMLPVPDMNVVVENDTHTFSAVTDEDGAYEFRSIPQGTYSIYLDAPEYYRLERQFAVGNETASVDIAAIPLGIFEAKANDLVSVDTPKAFTGVWAGSWRSDDTGTGAIRLTLTSQTAKLRGTLRVTRTDCGTVIGPFTGSFSSSTNRLSGSAASSCGGSNVGVKVTGTKSGSTLKGRYRTIVDGSLFDTGSYTMHKR